MGTELRQCTKCKEWFPATDEYFYKQLVRSKKKGDHYRLDSWCKKCKREGSRKWQDENPEKYAAQILRSREKREVDWQKEIERLRECSRRRREKGYFRELYKRNPDAYKVYRESHKNHDITNAEWLACKEYFNNECAYCGLHIEEHYIKFKGEFRLGDFHKEHVIHEGRNDLKNCIPSCKSCNSQKRTITLNGWYNPKNTVYTYGRYFKIYQWLRYDCKKHIQKKKHKIK